MNDNKQPDAAWLEHATANPGTVFSSPEAVLEDARLSDTDKIRVLRSWEYDCAELAVAEEEGMPGAGNSLLRRILLALRQLPDSDTDGGSSPSKQHGRSR